MASVMKVKFEHPRDLLNLVLAALLFVSPWLLGFAGEPLAAATAWVTGLVIAVVALAALFIKSVAWVESISLAMGVWTVAAPWILGFGTVMFALWAHVAAGVLLILVAGWEVWTDWGHKPVTT